LAEFSLFSGLEISISKSSITFSKECEDNLELQGILGFTPKKLPINYLLGLSITEKKKSYNQCWKHIQPIENLLTRWSKKYLSYGERIQLVNYIIAGKYTY